MNDAGALDGLSFSIDPDTGLRQAYEPNVAIDTLLEFPGNPKSHDLGAIIASLERNGMADAIKVQLSTRRIIGGHGTLKALRHLKRTVVPVLWIDCDDRTARRLLLAYNRAGELGGFEVGALADFLTEQAESGDLNGTGYDGDDVDAIRSSIVTPNFLPGTQEGQGKLDQRQPIECPHCHQTFTPA